MGFEPTHKGFADLSLNHLGTRSRYPYSNIKPPPAREGESET